MFVGFQTMDCIVGEFHTSNHPPLIFSLYDRGHLENWDDEERKERKATADGEEMCDLLEAFDQARFMRDFPSLIDGVFLCPIHGQSNIMLVVSYVNGYSPGRSVRGIAPHL